MSACARRGRDVVVTESNRLEFAQALVNYHLRDSIRGAVAAFCEGFYRVIPAQLVQMFTPKELQLLVSGPVDVDVEGLKLNCKVKGYTSTGQMLQWFWSVLKSFTTQQRRRLIGFVTGKDSLPVGMARLCSRLFILNNFASDIMLRWRCVPQPSFHNYKRRWYSSTFTPSSYMCM